MSTAFPPGQPKTIVANILQSRGGLETDHAKTVALVIMKSFEVAGFSIIADEMKKPPAGQEQPSISIPQEHTLFSGTMIVAAVLATVALPPIAHAQINDPPSDQPKWAPPVVPALPTEEQAAEALRTEQKLLATDQEILAVLLKMEATQLLALQNTRADDAPLHMQPMDVREAQPPQSGRK